ncbi:HAMP domain-containing histidine kinase [Candidatus Peregrinibacteria bacterium]|jgi:signal transduction histidine kinase|nr:HAMP domain-containing histidine kinase [Candidatus Peregrinibacteria bacterium]MBT4632209.1 HAMP domain-containing histidine kinase [Candidatus Peregrinibacteria bacterium]MBT5516316.1 HAMP domain-containing histidine kinase [Candidatus Peregrinibacteria bacterium]MBT5824380.1 HAMP domain-containing histidine kinase [Candidatus Peregrinibacteria bacterium]
MAYSEENFLKLQREYHYVATIQILLEKIFSSTELKEVMEALMDSMQVLAPSSAFAYVITDEEVLAYKNLVYVFIPGTVKSVGLPYLRELPKSMRVFVDSLSDDLQAKDVLAKQLEGHMHPCFVRGGFDKNRENPAVQVVTAPLSIHEADGKERVLGLFQVAWFDEDHQLDDTMIHHVHDVANLTAHSIEKIQTIQRLEDEKLEEAMKAKSEFLSFAAHQLRTPLGSMRWNMESLMNRDADLTPEMKDVFKENYESIKRLIDLVNHLLNLARTGTGSTKSNAEETDVVEVVQEVLEVEKEQFDKRKLQVEFEVQDEGLPPVMVDKKSFRECVQNLISNATKYNDEGGTLTVIVAKADENVRISVSDTGRGIPQEDQVKLFSKFYRAANASDDNTDGTGLGLFMVKSYVEAWKGKIWFESKEGTGSTFHIELPLLTK